MARHIKSPTTRQHTDFALYPAETTNSTRKSPDCNKGSEVGRLLANRRYDFVIAMGDDTTDEDMFQALPKSAIAIKIGSVSEAANYHLSAQSDVLPFLRSLLGKQKTATKEGSIKNRLTFAFDFLKDLLKTQ